MPPPQAREPSRPSLFSPVSLLLPLWNCRHGLGSPISAPTTRLLSEAQSVAGLQMSTYSLGERQNRQTTTVRIDTHTEDNHLSAKPKALISGPLQLHSVKTDSHIYQTQFPLKSCNCNRKQFSQGVECGMQGKRPP